MLPGITKIKIGGSNNGHNGLKDIQNKLNSKNFYRLRIGIGHPGDKKKVAKFVLNNLNYFEKKLIFCSIIKAVDCLDILFQKGITRAINFLHSK